MCDVSIVEDKILETMLRTRFSMTLAVIVGLSCAKESEEVKDNAALPFNMRDKH